MRLLNTVYVLDHQARVRIDKGNLRIEQPSGWLRVPIETVDAVLLLGRAEVSNSALGEMARRGVTVAALSKTGRLRFTVRGGTKGNVHLRIAQFRAAEDPVATARIARAIVAAKLQSARRVILRWSWDSSRSVSSRFRREAEVLGERVASLADSEDGDTIRGIEGDGTRRYFQCMGIHLGVSGAEFFFERRNRRPPRDPVNALLSYMYGVVLAEVVGALDAVGLDPQVGFLHRARSGRPSLALDLLEEFRVAVVDRFVVALLARQQIRGEHFDMIGNACYLSDAGRVLVLEHYEEFRAHEVDHAVAGRRVGRWALPQIQATLLARFLRGDLPDYPPFVTPP